MLFDSHAHYDDKRFNEDRDFLLSNMNKEGISYILNAGSSMKTSKKSVGLSNKYDFIYASVGVHPHDAEDFSENDIKELYDLAKNNKKVVAIGEIGLDYYYDNSPRDIQKNVFKMQLELAKTLSLPVVIHDRDSHLDCFNIVKESGVKNGVFHCFSGSAEFAMEILDLGFYISFAGPITYKNAVKTVLAAKKVPLDKILIETDCPYLSPVPERGNRNSSLFLKHTAQKIAEIKEISFEQLAIKTCDNAKNLFNIR